MKVLVPAAIPPFLLATECDSGRGYKMRPYTLDDHPALEQICKDVYGGSDYLPHTAQSLMEDPKSHFMVLEDQDRSNVVAVANARLFQPQQLWLEAVRTCQEHRGKGLATTITNSLLDWSRGEQLEMYTCTVESNVAMRKVFDRVGMKELGVIHQLKFSELKNLPGWGASDTTRTAKPLLQTLKMTHLISEEAKDKEWKQITSRTELQERLQKIQENGGIGSLPGLYELLSEEHVLEAMEHKRIWAIDTAVVAITIDEKIQSLSSPMVCSVAATSAMDLEAALWLASEKLNIVCTMAVDGAVPLEGDLLSRLPFVDDRCLLYGTAPLN